MRNLRSASAGVEIRLSVFVFMIELELSDRTRQRYSMLQCTSACKEVYLLRTFLECCSVVF